MSAVIAWGTDTVPTFQKKWTWKNKRWKEKRELQFCALNGEAGKDVDNCMSVELWDSAAAQPAQDFLEQEPDFPGIVWVQPAFTNPSLTGKVIAKTTDWSPHFCVGHHYIAFIAWQNFRTETLSKAKKKFKVLNCCELLWIVIEAPTHQARWRWGPSGLLDTYIYIHIYIYAYTHV